MKSAQEREKEPAAVDKCADEIEVERGGTEWVRRDRDNRGMGGHLSGRVRTMATTTMMM